MKTFDRIRSTRLLGFCDVVAVVVSIGVFVVFVVVVVDVVVVGVVVVVVVVFVVVVVVVLVVDVVVVVVFSFIPGNCLPRRTVDRLSAVGF